MKEDIEKVKKWLAKADEDLRAAEKLLLNNPEDVLLSIGFHCQQATEKYLKAFLTYHKVIFLFTHDLETLCQECSLIDKDFSHFGFKDLTDFAVVFRYNEIEETNLKEIKEYLEIARSVKHFVRNKINLEK